MGSARLLVWAAVLWLAAWSEPAAQSLEIEIEREPRRQLRTLEDAESAGEESRQLPGGPRVTYADVLRDPDDPALNLAYARTQLARGDLKGASATLERILLIAPDQPQVRLLRGIVLFRLRQYPAAEAELRTALQGRLPEDLRRQAEATIELLRERQRVTRFESTLSLGLTYDTNRNQAPSSRTRRFLGLALDAEGENDDLAELAILQVRAAHELGFQARHRLVGEAVAYSADQYQEDDLDLLLLGASGGVELDLGRLLATPRASFQHVQLGDEPYLRELGGSLDLVYRLRPTVQPYVRLTTAYEDFDRNNEAAPAAQQRDGWRTRGELGVDWQLSQTMALSPYGAVTRKTAQEGWEAYWALEFGATHRWLLGDGQFLATTASAETRGYDEVDLFVADEHRTEWTLTGRLSYGVPLGTLLGGLASLPEPLAGIDLIGTFEYTQVNSSLENFAYRNARAQVIVSRRFRF